MSQSTRMGRAGVRVSNAVQRATQAACGQLRRAVIERLEGRCLFAAGQLDTTFDGDGAAFHNHSGFSADDANAIAIQSDGKIVIAGATGSGSSYGDFVLLRYNTDGSLDTTFDGDGKVVTDFPSFNAGINAMALQADGKIVVGGRIDAPNTWDWIVARYNTNGTLDTTFDGDGYLTKDFFGLGFGDELYAISIQPGDGKIVATGVATGGTSEMATIRLNTNGTFDTTFDGDGIAYMDFFGGVDYASDVIAQSDGKILVVGGSVPSGSYRRFCLVRYNSNGTLDTTFDTDGKASTDFGVSAFGRQVVRQSDGKYVVGGLVGGVGTSMNWGVARYNTNGTIDTTFGTGGPSAVPGSTVIDIRGHTFVRYGMAVQGDDKVLFGGYAEDPASTTTTYFGLARFTSSGALDATFDTDGKVTTDASLLYGAGVSGTGSGTDLALAADGKIVMTGGAYTSGTTTSDFTTLRYLGDGGGPAPTTYDWDATPFQSIDLVPGAPGVSAVLDGQDDANIAIPLGANTFRFYDTNYTQLFVNTNGLITFGSGSDDYNNTDLSASPALATIAPMWDDWLTNTQTSAAGATNDVVLYQFDAANNRLIIEWNHIRNIVTSAPSPATFQAILQLNTGGTSGEIYFNYPDLDTGSASFSNGGGATVGIKPAGAVVDELLINMNNSAFPYVQSGVAIRVFPVGAATGGSISGRVYEDRDSDHVFDAGEPALNGVTVYDDANENNILDAGEMSTVTSGAGDYSFTGLAAGEYNITQVIPTGYISIEGATGVFLGDGSHIDEVDRGLFPTRYTGTSGNDSYTLRLNAAGTHTEVLVGGVLTYTIHKANLSSLEFAPGAGDDTLTVDWTNGDPTLNGAVQFLGGLHTTGDQIIATGTSLADSFEVYVNAVVRAGTQAVFIDAGVEGATVNALGGDDTVYARSNNTNGPITINTGSGTNTVNVFGTSNSITGLSGTVTVNGQGLDTVVVNDSGSAANAGYTITSSTFDRSSFFGLLVYNTIEAFNLIAQASPNTITVSSTNAAVAYTLNAGAGIDTVNLNGAAAGTAIQVNGENDNDALTIAAAVATTVSYNGGAGTDSVTYNGSSALDTINVTNGSVTGGGKTLNYVPGAAPETISILALAGQDTVNVLFNPAGTSLSINGGTDSDTVNIAPFSFPGRNVDDVDGTVSFTGGGGTGDTLNYNDQDNPAASTTYNITNSSVTRAGSAVVSFLFISNFNFNSPNATALIYVTGTLSGTQTNINLNNGNQYVQLGNDLNFFAGPISVYDFGTTGGFDTVWLADVVSASDPYTITSTQVTRPFFAGLTYGNLESLVIDSQNGNNTYTINGIGTGTALEIHGNGGSDSFVVNSIFGNMNLQGGFGAANVDTLTVNDTANTISTLTPTTLSDASRTITYSTLESMAVTLSGGSDTMNLTGTTTGTAVTVNGNNGNDTLNINGAPSSPVTFNGGLTGGYTDTLNVNAGTFTFNADANTATANLVVNVNNSGSSAVFNTTQHLAGLALTAGGTALMPANGNNYLFTKNLSIAASSVLNLADNDILWDYTGGSPYETMRMYVLNGRDNAGGLGGIAFADSTGNHILAPVDNEFFLATEWLGQPIDLSTIIGKWTFYGDANIDGQVTTDDYVAVDLGLGTGTTWGQGDVDLNGTVTTDDYVVIDLNLGAGVGDPAATPEEAESIVGVVDSTAPTPSPVGGNKRGGKTRTSR